jgi:hypothetical protein
MSAIVGGNTYDPHAGTGPDAMVMDQVEPAFEVFGNIIHLRTKGAVLNCFAFGAVMNCTPGHSPGLHTPASWHRSGPARKYGRAMKK